VFFPKKDPYMDAWLRRTGRQFAASGRLSQIATALSSEDGVPLDEWRARLRAFLEGEEIPSLELLTRIDALLAGSSKPDPGDDAQGSLF
jgi:hypothetical protein